MEYKINKKLITLNAGMVLLFLLAIGLLSSTKAKAVIQTSLHGGIANGIVDVPAQADYDNDGKADIAYFRPSTGAWEIIKSSDGLPLSYAHGGISTGIADIPVPADYDGDGTDDIACYRIVAGAWEIVKSSDSLTLSYTHGSIVGGLPDVPVPADYDDDGMDDIAYFRPSTGIWEIIKSSDGQPLSYTHGGISGGIADIPVPGDYDGDTIVDIAYYRILTGAWEIIKSSDSLPLSYVHGGIINGIADIPVPGDYDGDGIDDIGYFRPSTGEWEIIKSSDSLPLTKSAGGINSGVVDVPVQEAYGGEATQASVFRPLTGEWMILNEPPSIQITEPDGTGDTADASYTITWIDEDVDDNASISLYYDTDSTGQDGTLITSGISESNAADSYSWDTSAVGAGDYYVYGIIDDGANTQVVDYSDGTVTISHAPVSATIQVVEPDGSGDLAEDSFVIRWVDEYEAGDAAVTLFYDTDSSGQDGIQITDCDPISEDDETDECTWDTSAVPEGGYYIYAIINDGVNPQAVDYSFYPVLVNRQGICPTSLCNGDFESATDLEYWTLGNGTNQAVTDIVQDGTKAYYTEHLHDTGFSPRWSGIWQNVMVESAQTYGLTGFYQSDNAAQGHVKISWKDIGGTVLQVDYPVTNINGTNSNWIEFSKLVIAPAGAFTAEIRIWHGVNTSIQNQLGSKLWVDSLAFEVATTACGTLCNESFEHGILYWIQSGAVGSHTIEQTGVHEGLKTLKSVQLFTTSDETKWAGVTQYAQVKEGTTYRLRSWFKTQSAVNGHIRIRWRDDGGALLGTQYPVTGIGGTNSSWFNREATLTAPATAARAEVTLWHGVTSTNSTGSTMWIDDITLICLSLCNGGFEDGNVHWETNGINEGEVVMADVQEGSQALKIVQGLDNTYNTQWAGVSQRTLVAGGSNYNLSFWLKKENAVQGHVKIKWRDADDMLISQQFPIGGINGTNLTWTEMNTALTAPANAETIEIFIWHGVDGSNQNATGSTIYVDNVTLTQSP